MELELPPRKNCLAHLSSRIFEMFKKGKITFGLGQSNTIFQTTACKANRKVYILL